MFWEALKWLVLVGACMLMTWILHVMLTWDGK